MPLSHNQALCVTALRQFTDQKLGLAFTTAVMRSEVQMADGCVDKLTGLNPNTKAPAGP